jgi:diguanylate cyclase (GGDEF)-like protein
MKIISVLQEKIKLIIGNFPERGLEYRTLIIFIAASLFMNTLGLISDYFMNNYSLQSLVVKITLSVLLIINFFWARFSVSWKTANVITVLIIPCFFLPGGWLTNGGMIGGFQYYPVIMGMIIAALSHGRFRNFALSLHLIVLFVLIFNPEFRNGIPKWTNPDSIIPETAMIRRMIHLYINMIMTAFLFVIYARKLRKQQWQLKEHSKKLAVLATIDDLTQISNHRHILEELNVEIARSARYGAELSVIMIDVDHFKSINDENGHTCGDNVLRKLGELLKTNLRTTDKVGRYGGEEFLVVLPEQNEVKALVVAEKLRKFIQESDLSELYSKGVTISSGVAQWINEEPPSELISRADSAMYNAKKNGRNCVFLSK